MPTDAPTLNPVVTLLTDFGLQDAYVGVMKGVMAQINPNLTVIDLTHQIPPQNLAAARFNLMNAYPYFPPGTVHVAVVDPGVGSARRAIAIQLPNGFLVGPDNGLFSGVLSQTSPLAAVQLTNSAFWRVSTPSTTFHGRDIFAPVGAHLASGVSLPELGPSITLDSLVTLPLPGYEKTEERIAGSIQHIDHFGNLITNIPGHEVAHQHWSAIAGDIMMSSKFAYSDSPTGGFLTLVGSHGWVEIAVNGGNAQAQLQLQVGDRVYINF